MTRLSARAAVELSLSGLAALCCVLSWAGVRTTVLVAPIADGEPATTSATYDPQLLVLTLLLATVAGVLGVVGSARIHRGRRADKATAVSSDTFSSIP